MREYDFFDMQLLDMKYIGVYVIRFHNSNIHMHKLIVPVSILYFLNLCFKLSITIEWHIWVNI